MKFTRLIIAFLILALASAPAFAAICAVTCAADSALSAMPDSSASGHHHNVSAAAMDHCHMSQSGKSDTGKPSSGEHKGCMMAGCHFSITTPLLSLQQFKSVDVASTTLPSYDSSLVFTYLPPPIKPPA